MSTSPTRDEPERERPRDDSSELEKKIVETAKYAVPAGTVVIASFAGLIFGASAVILVLAGGALVAVIAVFWASVRTLLGETPLSGADAYALGAPRAEEEQKRAVLRALKDLEFERSVGKISEQDYQDLVAKYRAEAKRLLRALEEDAQPRRDHVEALVQKRLRREGLIDQEEPEAEAKPAEEPEAEAPAAPVKPKKRKKARRDRDAEPKAAPVASEDPEAEAPASEPEAKPKAKPEDAEKVEEVADRVCASCGTVNDVDAVFCKKCGSRRKAQGEAEAS